MDEMVGYERNTAMIKVHMSLEKETKNTVRFTEDEEQPDDHPGAPVLSTLYIQKFAHVQMGRPEHIVVALEVKI